MELFVNGNRMQLARWPNDGWLHIADVPQTGDSMLNTGLDREKRFDGVPVGRHYGRISFSEDRPATWATGIGHLRPRLLDVGLERFIPEGRAHRHGAS